MTEELALIADIWKTLGDPNPEITKILNRKEFTIEDLLTFNVEISDLDEDYDEMITSIKTEILYRIPNDNFCKEITRIVNTSYFKKPPCTKSKNKKKNRRKRPNKGPSKRRTTLLKMKEFLENEEQYEYDNIHTINLYTFLDQIPNEKDRSICELLIKKINTLLIADEESLDEGTEGTSAARTEGGGALATTEGEGGPLGATTEGSDSDSENSESSEI